MTQNNFDPSKLDIDFSNLDAEIPALWESEKKENPPSPQNDILENISSTEVLWSENPNLNITKEQKNEVDINTLSTILTDSAIRPDILKKFDEEKIITPQKEENKIIFDININTIDDLLEILLKNQYDFFAIEPGHEYVKISFKKDSILKDAKYIKFPVYMSLLLKAKTISKLNLENTSEEQKGSGIYDLRGKSIEVLSKTIPWVHWETLFVKAKLSEQKVAKKAVQKKSISAGSAFGFLWAILFIALVLGWAFLTFVIFNAKTPEDVSFFASLGINLNDINSFLLKLTTLIFSIVIVIETIVLIILLFKAIFTKKEFKRKRTVWFILSTLMLIITFSTASLWMYLDKTIKGLPNWLELSYGMIQIYDNNLLNDKNVWKNGAIIQDYSSLIWPIDLKFDVTYLQKEEQRIGFRVTKFIWNFWDGQKAESQTPEMIHTFEKKGSYKISLTLEWVDSRFPDKLTTKPASENPEITLSYIVNVTEKVLENGWKTISFDANDLKPLWEIEWYLQEDLAKPAYTGYMFQPSKIYFEPDLIGMKIKNSPSNYMSRIFTIRWETSEIAWEIVPEVSFNNDLEYNFHVANIENNFWDWFIESFTWIIDGQEIKKQGDILRLEESSTIKYTFKEYGNYDVKVILTNSNGKSTQLTTNIQTAKKIKLTNNIDFYVNGSKLDNIKYDAKVLEYFIYDVGIPTKLQFDAKHVRADNPLYALEEIKWDVWSNGSYEGEWKIFDHQFNFWWFEEVSVRYKFVHRRNKEDIVEFTQKVNFEFVEKEAIVDLQIKSDSEYVPALVAFDASLSKVQNDNIVKFIYDYWDGVVEERDAINPWHRYLKEWNYTVKLTIITKNGKEYSTSKSLVLKSFEAQVKIKTSMKKAPVNQEIDFLSTDSTGQIVRYHWDFGDGNFSSEANPSHAFKKAGTYKVKLTLDFANNNVMSDEIEIEITE